MALNRKKKKKKRDTGKRKRGKRDTGHNQIYARSIQQMTSEVVERKTCKFLKQIKTCKRI